MFQGLKLKPVKDEGWRFCLELSGWSFTICSLFPVFQAGKSSALQDFPLLQYQNSFHLFRCVETLLQSSQVPYRVEVGSDPTGFLAHLQQRVFLLSEEFPLFSMNMWMVGGLLTSAQL